VLQASRVGGITSRFPMSLPGSIKRKAGPEELALGFLLGIETGILLLAEPIWYGSVVLFSIEITSVVAVIH
jgi:hypothetical protein